jgi:hypothetical protein
LDTNKPSLFCQFFRHFSSMRGGSIQATDYPPRKRPAVPTIRSVFFLQRSSAERAGDRRQTLARILRLSDMASAVDAPCAEIDQFGVCRWLSCIVLRLLKKRH